MAFEISLYERRKENGMEEMDLPVRNNVHKYVET